MYVILAALCFGWAMTTFAETNADFPPTLAMSQVEELRSTGQGLHNESSLGFTLNGGNSDSQSLNVRQSTAYGWGYNRLLLGAHYLYGRAGNTEAANNWSIEPRYERYFSPKLGAFLANRWEGNRFAGIDYRSNVDVGAKYFLVGNQDSRGYLLNETGYRFQYEDRIPGQNPQILRNQFARVFFEGRTQITDAVWVKAWVELLPNFTRSQDYLVNFEPSLGVMLSNALSLQLAFLGQYDGFPVSGKKSFDYIYTTSIVASY